MCTQAWLGARGSLRHLTSHLIPTSSLKSKTCLTTKEPILAIRLAIRLRTIPSFSVFLWSESISKSSHADRQAVQNADPGEERQVNSGSYPVRTRPQTNRSSVLSCAASLSRQSARFALPDELHGLHSRWYFDRHELLPTLAVPDYIHMHRFFFFFLII